MPALTPHAPQPAPPDSASSPFTHTHTQAGVTQCPQGGNGNGKRGFSWYQVAQRGPERNRHRERQEGLTGGAGPERDRRTRGRRKGQRQKRGGGGRENNRDRGVRGRTLERDQDMVLQGSSGGWAVFPLQPCGMGVPFSIPRPLSHHTGLSSGKFLSPLLQDADCRVHNVCPPSVCTDLL